MSTIENEKKYTAKIIGLNLANGYRMLFFTHRESFNHETFDEKTLSGEIYYINSGTCPINWFNEVKQIAVIDPMGQIEMDPHGDFTLISNQQVADLPDDCMKRDDFFLSMGINVFSEERRIRQFLSDSEGEKKDPRLVGEWEYIIYSRENLLLLNNIINEKEDTLTVDIKGNKYSVEYNYGVIFSVENASKEIIDRLNVLIEFGILKRS